MFEEIVISNRSRFDQNCVCRKFYYDRRDPYGVFSGAVHRDYCLCLPFDRVGVNPEKKPFFCNTLLLVSKRLEVALLPFTLYVFFYEEKYLRYIF